MHLASGRSGKVLVYSVRGDVTSPAKLSGQMDEKRLDMLDMLEQSMAVYIVWQSIKLRVACSAQVMNDRSLGRPSFVKGLWRWRSSLASGRGSATVWKCCG